MRSSLAIEQIDNESDSTEYMRRQLAKGTSLAASFLASTDLEQGLTLIATPRGHESHAFPDFESSYLPIADGAQEETLVALAQSFLAQPNRALVVQDFEVSPQDPFLDSYMFRHRASIRGHELYWIIGGEHQPEDEILGVITSGSRHPFTAFFCLMDLHEKDKLSEDDVAELVRRTVGVAVGIFDETSFLLWWKRGEPLPPTDWL